MSTVESKKRTRISQPIIPWRDDETIILKDNLKKYGDTKEALDNAYAELLTMDNSNKRSRDAVKTRIYNLGMAGDLIGVCNCVRFMKLKEKARQKKLIKEKEEFERSKHPNLKFKDQLVQRDAQRPENDSSTPKKKKKKKVNKNIVDLTKLLDSQLIVCGSSVIGGKAVFGKIIITGKFTVEVSQ